MDNTMKLDHASNGGFYVYNSAFYLDRHMYIIYSIVVLSFNKK